MSKSKATKYDNTIGLLFGVESEGFITNDDGTNCYPAHDWLPGCSSPLGTDGRSDTVEYRSAPFIHIDTLKEDIIKRVLDVKLPKESKLMFYPAAEYENSGYGNNLMPCGLHISYSLNNNYFKYEGKDNILEGDIQDYVESKLPMELINEFEGKAGNRRRDGNYGTYDYSPFSRRTPECNGYIGLEYRVLSSSMSDFRSFQAVLGMYIWLVWTYYWDFFSASVEEFHVKGNCNPVYTPTIQSYIKETMKYDMISNDMINEIIKSCYNGLKSEFKRMTGINITNSIRHIMNLKQSKNGYRMNDIFDELKLKKNITEVAYCAKCCRKSTRCDCKDPCAKCNNTTYSGRLCSCCHTCCECSCIHCNCGTSFATQEAYNEHVCSICNRCRETGECTHRKCNVCDNMYDNEFICNNCESNCCDNCCACSEPVSGDHIFTLDDMNTLLYYIAT